MASTINSLTALARNQDYSDVEKSQSLLKKIESGLSNTASVVQLSDSYLGDGTVGKIVSNLIDYITL